MKFFDWLFNRNVPDPLTEGPWEYEYLPKQRCRITLPNGNQVTVKYFTEEQFKRLRDA